MALTSDESRVQLAAGRYAQLWENLVQMSADGAVRDEQLLADFPVGQAVGGQPGDLQFLGGQLVPRSRFAAPAPTF